MTRTEFDGIINKAEGQGHLNAASCLSHYVMKSEV